MIKDNLRFNARFGRSVFDLHCQVWKVDEAMCSINDFTVML